MTLFREFILPRLVQWAVVIFVGVTITFLIPRLSPINPVEQALGRMTTFQTLNPEATQAMRQTFLDLYGLDGNLLQQYLKFWERLFVGDSDFSVLENGFIVAVPYVFAAIALILWPRHAARSGDIGWHVLISAVVGALGIVVAAFGSNPWVVMVGVTLCAVGVISAMPLVYSLPARILSSIAVGAGLALVNTVGNVGGFAGPFVTGWLRDLFGNDQVPFIVVALLLLMSGVISVLVQSRTRSINQSLQIDTASPVPAPGADTVVTDPRA